MSSKLHSSRYQTSILKFSVAGSSYGAEVNRGERYDVCCQTKMSTVVAIASKVLVNSGEVAKLEVHCNPTVCLPEYILDDAMDFGITCVIENIEKLKKAGSVFCTVSIVCNAS